MVDILPANSPALSATSDMPSAGPAVTTPAEPNPDVVPLTTPVEPVVTATEPTSSPAPAAPKEPIGARLSELSRQRREADERAARLELLVGQQGEQLTKALEALTKVSSQARPQVPTQTNTGTSSRARPTRDEFSDPTDFEVALVSWASEEAASRAASEMERRQEEARAEADRVAEEARLAGEEETRRVRENENIAAVEASWKEKQEKASAKYEDFLDVVLSSQVPISDPVGFIIKTSDDGAEIAYYLAKHPDEAAKIAAMVIPGQVYPPGQWNSGFPVADPLKQAVAIGKLATKLGLEIQTEPVIDTNTNSLVVPAPSATTLAPAAPAPTQTIVLAPSPPNPISGANANATQRTLYDAGNEGSMEEYAAMRRPQLLAERRPGRALN